MRDERFENAEQEFFKLKGQLDAGRITPEQFDQALRELIVEDDQGRFWMLGADSGKWYLRDGEVWVEANPPSVAEREPKVIVPASAPQPPAQPSRRVPKIILAIAGGLLTLLLGLGVTWGQGLLRTAFQGSAVTPTRVIAAAPTQSSATPIPTETPTRTPTATLASPTASPTVTDTPTATPEIIVITTTPLPPINSLAGVANPSPQVIIITATPLPPAPTATRSPTPAPLIIIVTATAPPRTNTPTPTRTNTLTPPTRTSTVTPSAIPMPTFPSSVITWSTGYDQANAKPLGVVTNKTFTNPIEIYASWNSSGIPAGATLRNDWYYNGALWAQGEYVLQTENASLWYSTFRKDGLPLPSGTYRLEIKLGGQLILTDQAVVK